MRPSRRGEWKRRWWSGIAVAALAVAAAFASEFRPAVLVPGRVPERIILGWRGDPATSQAVTWRTVLPVEHPQAQLAVFTARPDFEAGARTVAATTTRLELGAGQVAYHHRAELTGLDPDTAYCYRVGDGETWSEWSRFRTASSGPAPFRFIYLGDAQNAVRSLWSRAVRAAWAHAPDARFIVITGDLTSEGWDDRLWGEWCDALGFISASVPILATPGNHDEHRRDADPAHPTVWSVQPTWRAHLTVPHDGPAGVEELRDEAYVLDYQGVRFVSLDANVYANEDFAADRKTALGQAQTRWLESVLDENPNRWTIVVEHQPFYSVAKDRDHAELRAALLPIVDAHRVDLVLVGHDHRYARTHKLSGGRVVDPAAPGTIYALSVSGPKLHRESTRYLDLMAVTEGASQMFEVVTVDGDRLRYEAFTIAGELVDAFELRRGASGVSTYANLAPASHRVTPSPVAR